MSTRTAALGQRATLGKAFAATFLLASLAACAGDSSPPETAGPAPTLDGKPPSGFVDMRELQVAYIGDLGGGDGTLTYQGETYPFKIAGLGVGGIGVSTVDAEGEVFNLSALQQFPGSYAAGQYGVVAGTASAGDIWLKNENDVVLHLKAKREGLMLAVGADAIEIEMQE